MKRRAKDFIRTLGLSLGLAGLIIAAASVSAASAEKIRYRRHRFGNQDRQHHAVQRAGIGLWHHRQDDERLFRMINDNGGVNGPARSISFPMTTPTARRNRGAGAQAG